MNQQNKYRIVNLNSSTTNVDHIISLNHNNDYKNALY